MWGKFLVSKKIVISVSLLCVVGLLVAIYLTWLHYQVHTNPSFHSFCAMNDAFNCETVAESPYAVFLRMPVAVWGIIGYFFMFLVATIGVGKHKLASAYCALLLASAFSVITSVALAIISYCIICSFCIMCSVTYGINLLIFLILLSETIRLHFPIKSALTELVIFLRSRILFVIALVPAMYVLCLVFPQYWVDAKNILNNHIQHGITQDGHAWIGAEKPEIEIIEFSDYLCPHCKRTHAFMRALVANNPKKLRLIHRHFPLDNACNPLIKNPFHEGACLIARTAICAKKQNQFWKGNDLLYSADKLTGNNWEERAKEAARLAGLDLGEFNQCLASESTQTELNNDINEGLRLGLKGTPSFILNDKVYVGIIDKNVLEQYGLTLPTQ